MMILSSLTLLTNMTAAEAIYLYSSMVVVGTIIGMTYSVLFYWTKWGR